MYRLLKIWVRAGLWFYCDRIFFGLRKAGDGPTILACNHPNSFLDAIIIACLYQKPIHFMVRGDVFEKPWANRLLRLINMIPVYRLSEGRSQLKKNARSFDECIGVLKNNGTLLIFPESICRHEWSIRPLKKGTARLTCRAWKDEGIIDLVIRPVTLSYTSFSRIPISLSVREGETLISKQFDYAIAPRFYEQFNTRLHQQLEIGVITESKLISSGSSYTKKIFLALPAFIGWLTHKGFYRLVKRYAKKKTEGSVFFHSVLFGLLLFTYPIALLALTGVLVLLSGQSIVWLMLLALPFTGWCYKNYHSSFFNPVQRQQSDDPVR